MNGAEAIMLRRPQADQGHSMVLNDDSMLKTADLQLLSMRRAPMLRMVARPAAGTLT